VQWLSCAVTDSSEHKVSEALTASWRLSRPTQDLLLTMGHHSDYIGNTTAAALNDSVSMVC
jgi:hypothetical protein